MKKRAFALLCLFCSPAIGETTHFEIPEQATLALDDTYEYENWFKFKGQAEVSGRYEFIYDENSPHESLTTLYVYPDAKSVELLPYMREENRTYKINEIFIRNVRIAAESLLGKPSAEKLLTGREAVFSGRATIVIGQVEAGYESDSLLFIGDFIEKTKP